jgi:16S rRNA (guanine527-N7)-methyltransferase
MPSANAAGGARPQLPPDLEANRREFLEAVDRAVSARAADDPVRAWLTDARARDLWDRYIALVRRQSSRLAIVARGDIGRLYTRHLLDSLNPLSFFDAPAGSLLDVGSGGGFPGIPLGIAWPGAQVTLLESREKKVGFLELVIRQLGLPNVRAVCARLEERGASWREERPYDLVTVRAVGDLPALLRSVRVACAPGARWVYFLGSGERLESLAGDLRQVDAEFEAREGLFGGLLLLGRWSRART